MSPFRTSNKSDDDEDEAPGEHSATNIDDDMPALVSDDEDDEADEDVDNEEAVGDDTDEEGERVLEEAINEVELLPLLPEEAAEAKAALSKVGYYLLLFMSNY